MSEQATSSFCKYVDNLCEKIQRSRAKRGFLRSSSIDTYLVRIILKNLDPQASSYQNLADLHKELELVDHQLASNNRLLVRWCAVRFYKARGAVAGEYQHFTLDDLISEGELGLYTAINKFDCTRGTAFSTYATYHITVRMQRLWEKRYVVRVPLEIMR